jgi:translation initiation factor 4E
MDSPLLVARGASDHLLSRRWCLWFMQRSGAARGSNIGAEDYEKSIKPIAEFDSVEGFWQVYNHIRRANDIGGGSTELHLFRAGVKPVWEDKANQYGGKLLLRLTKGLASHYWEALLLAIIGEQFDQGDEVCGAVISLRANEDIISIWNRNADNQASISRLRENLKTLLDLPVFVRLEYKRHSSRTATGRSSATGQGPPQQQQQQQLGRAGAVPQGAMPPAWRAD